MKRAWLLLGVAGALLAGASAKPGAAETVTVLVPVTVTSEPAVDVTTETSASAATADDVAAEGTRAQPIPVGTPATVGDWMIVFDPTVPDAGEVIAAENQFNDPAPAGKQFVMATVHATYNGAGSKAAWLELRIQFVGVGGNTFGSSPADYCGTIPDALNDAGEVFAGATASGNECAAVASDQVAGGSWAVVAGFGSDPVFFATQ